MHPPMPAPCRTSPIHCYCNPTAAVVGCIKAGITVFLDQFATPLRDALEKKLLKLLTEGDIADIRGNLRMRMRLGEFDPPDMVPYSKISGRSRNPGTVKPIRRWPEVTQESIVLLEERRWPIAARQEQTALHRGDRAVWR